MKSKATLTKIAATLLLTAASGTLLVHGQKSVARKVPPGRVPPVGDYSCMYSYLTYSPVSGPGGPMMIIQYSPSVMGTITLDGKGGYRAFKKSGRYTFNLARRKFAFVSGPLKDWPVVYEVSSGNAMLRLAGTKTGTIKASSQIGDNTCSWRGSTKFADSPPPADVGGPATVSNTKAGPRNGGAKGTLTFRQEWGSGDGIVDLNLASGKVEMRFEGTQPFRGAKGETAFVNKAGALVIANSKGIAAATIPVPENLERPDMPVLSPDNSKIAFHVEPIYWDSRVLVATRSGKILAEFKDMTEPDWTPDGRLIVAKDMGTEKSKPGIFLSDAGLNRLSRIDPNLDNASQPAVSPDGKRVALVQHGHIWLMNLDGSALKQLSFSDNAEERPAWSPDSQWIAAATKQYGKVILISTKSGKIIDATNKDDKTMQSQGRLSWR